MWFDPGLAGLFITSTLLHLGEDISSLVMSLSLMISFWLMASEMDGQVMFVD
jgi:hypothetical protein